MSQITIQLHRNGNWLDAALMTFHQDTSVSLEYDLDYMSENLGYHDARAVSVVFPVDAKPYRGRLPGFVLDLIPQGEALKRLMSRYHISNPENYRDILAKVPLAAPGNIRIKEAWLELDRQRQSYRHPGFPLTDIVKHSTSFIDYMEQHGAPIGGTSGAGGGAPKFLLRQDQRGNFHAEGMLSDANTRRSYLVKFPYTDSQNAIALANVEKVYYDILRQLPLRTGAAIHQEGTILFLERFDRVIASPSVIYHGLESLYSAHNIAIPGARLWHEDNLKLIEQITTSPEEEMVEYLKRDIVNKVLANTDNHGRNTSFLKQNESIRLSPVYDVTAMKFFTGDFIVELTRWQDDQKSLSAQTEYLIKHHGVTKTHLLAELKKLAISLRPIETWLKDYGVPEAWRTRSTKERQDMLTALNGVCGLT